MIDRTTKPYFLETAARDPRLNKRGRIRRFLKRLALAAILFTAMVLAMRLIIPMVIDAAEREAQWREERLCRIYAVCDPKAGP